MFGTLTGALLPIILRKLGFDPASASAPLVATMVDVTGLIIYFLAAKAFVLSTL
jgi:magnesium transporter